MIDILKKIAVLIISSAAISASVIFAGIAYGMSSDLVENRDFGCVVILGAGLDRDAVSDRLKRRLDKAVEISSEINAPIIVSGGQGPGESISEAEGMKRYLVSKGIDKKRIILEDRSTSTVENLKFTKKLLVSHSLETPKKILIVSSDYHVFRTRMISAIIGINSEVVGCKSARDRLAKSIAREYPATIKTLAELSMGFFAPSSSSHNERNQ